MDKESKRSSSVQSLDRKQQRKEPSVSHTASPSPLILPNPYESNHSLRGNKMSLSSKQQPSNTNEVPAGKGDDLSRSHSYSSSRRVRETTADSTPRDRSVRGAQAKTWKSSNASLGQSRAMGSSSLDTQKKGFKVARPAPNSAGKSKPAQTHSQVEVDLVPFEVKMADFPELAGVSLGKMAAPVQTESMAPALPSRGSVTTAPSSLWKSGRRETPIQQDRGSSQQQATNVKTHSSVSSPAGQMVSSWANVASQPPKKPVPKEKSNLVQIEETVLEQEEGALGKKKRKRKKKKGKGAGEDAEAETEGAAVYQEPPKFEDEEEFPGLTLTLTGLDRLMASSSTTKLCNEENQREDLQHQYADQTKEKSSATKAQSTESAQKGQKAEKVSGKKSKVPVQLDIGDMLTALEKKKLSQKAKQDAKPVILSVGGGLPVVQKQPTVQKKLPWQQDKIAHNPLDSTSPLVKKGKQREVPKAKKPTPLKRVILKEREERKQRRLLEERGLLPENEIQPVSDDAEENVLEPPDDIGSSEELDNQSELNSTNEMAMEADKEADTEQETTSTVPCPTNGRKIHSRKFRDYCSQMLSKDVDECVTTLLKELVRFQDRLYQKDPMKARMKRRIVMGLREVLKHLKLHKVKCVVISPNCERIQSKGGLDEALYTIIDTCREQDVPFVFALSRKALGRCVNKAVPVSLVGIFNYDGAQDIYHKMIELSSEARRAYEAMVLSLDQTETEQEVNTEEDVQISPAEETDPSPDATQPEEPEYIKIWKRMLEKDSNHKFLNFEEQLSSMCLESECTESTGEDEKT
ncbi:uncharacterized protein V6R79_005764 [Siganus canaliculatus]